MKVIFYLDSVHYLVSEVGIQQPTLVQHTLLPVFTFTKHPNRHLRCWESKFLPEPHLGLSAFYDLCIIFQDVCDAIWTQEIPIGLEIRPIGSEPFEKALSVFDALIFYRFPSIRNTIDQEIIFGSGTAGRPALVSAEEGKWFGSVSGATNGVLCHWEQQISDLSPNSSF